MLSRQPSMRAIAAFEAAARHESFAAAGKELNLTQSAISHSIRGLEAQIGARLFDRKGPTIRLTDRGRGLAEQVRHGLVLLAQALNDVAGVAARRRLVAAGAAGGLRRVLLAWPAIQAGAPGLEIELRPDLGVRDLETGEADVVLLFGEANLVGHRIRSLGRDRVFPVIAPHRRLDAARFPDLDLIENTEHPWALWFGHQRTPSVVRAPALSVADWDLAVDAARAGLGVALARESQVDAALARGELLRVGAQTMPCAAALNAVWRAGGEIHEGLEPLLAALARTGSAPDEEPAGGLLHARL